MLAEQFYCLMNVSDSIFIGFLTGTNYDNNGHDHSPLRTAVDKGDLLMAKLLIKHGANVNYDNNGYDYSPLRTAVDKGDLLMAELLIEHGANVNYDNNGYDHSPLWAAVNKGDLPLAKLLMKHGANVNYDNNGYDHSPLMTAVDKGDIEMAFVLIRKGANINVENKCKLTKLMEKYDTTPEALATTPFSLQAFAYRQVFALTESRKIPIDDYPLPLPVKEVLKDRTAFPFYRLASANN
ncbi:ankyrin repeat domain-containing protein [Endozoicomonas gorgoniicola]|uniref:Ankyrin repeat domain-containing protein n=1 Tax=Endozoicomonas gorgoniicola TaxID=1234144 RepID=A0ABT3MXE2_9GAMM|nr:ankyrin repeat domain-containing protein [Endozoicomonas gorgoniicola]MCW7554052.1 ankyrin repeat domain-containing protein [Endozoicomonas gorgoniicola]